MSAWQYIKILKRIDTTHHYWKSKEFNEVLKIFRERLYIGITIKVRWQNWSAKCIYGFSDIDECKGNHSCHVNAKCNNTLGSHVCECQVGCTGNGQNCTGEINFFVTIFTSVKEITPVTWMLSAITPLDHMYVNVKLGVLEMDKTAQVKLISSLRYLK